MGWGNCGTDSQGRSIGYNFEATCDADGCTAEIDRGLSYACGGMHGGGEHMCEGYFCPDHLTPGGEPAGHAICHECSKAMEADARADLVEHARLQRTRMDQARSAAEYWQAAERFAMDVDKLLPELKQPEGS